MIASRTNDLDFLGRSQRINSPERFGGLRGLPALLRIAAVWLFTLGWCEAQNTFTAEYGSVKFDKAGATSYALSIPTLKGQQLPAIRGVVISNPGIGGNTAYQVNERWVKWLYENGFAYIGNDSAYSAGSFSALADYADDDLGGITYPELAHVPVFVFGESAGGTSTTSLVYSNPERVLAFVVEHTRFFLDVDEATDPAAVKAVPGYYRWGEWDHGRFNEGYFSAGGGEANAGTLSAKNAIHSMIARGAQWMTAIEHRQDHATKRYAFEEAMGFFGLMLPLRYDYQQGVAGKDPKLGAVNLRAIAREDGYLGEHLFGAIQSKVTLNEFNEIDTSNTYYPNFLKDWESRDPYYAPFADFTRINKDEGHSWMANADLAAFWATKFSQGNNDLHVEYPDMLSDAFGASSVYKNNSLFPNLFNTGQTIRISVDPVDFPNTQTVEFYANSTLKGSVENAPFDFTYAFDANETGMFALYAVAVSTTGERCLGPRRMVQIYPENRGANTAPTISAIGNIVGNPNQILSIPFTIGDANGDSLTVVWREVNRANIDSGSYTASIGGAGNSRTLDLTMPSTPGMIWGLVQVSDGDMSTNSYVTIHVTGDGSAAPFFVANEAVGADGRTAGEHIADGWTRRISVRVYDYDTDPRDLTLTATSDNTTALPDENILVGGAGEYRYIRVKQTGSANITLTLSDDNSFVSETFSLPRRTQDNTPPVLSAIADQTAFYSNTSDPIEVRLYDLHTPGEALLSGEPILNLSVTSGNQTLIQDGNIRVTEVGSRRQVSFTPEYNQTGTVTLTATATDAGGLSTSTTFDVTVSTPPALDVPDDTLANATVTQSYSKQLIATGGIQPYTWSLLSGSLPTGLTLDADGTLNGTPVETGSFTFTAEATDSNPGGSVSESGHFTLDVLSLLTPPEDVSGIAETNTTITLTWSDTASGETGYEIERRTAGDLIWAPLTTTSADAVTHTDNNALVAGTSYEYRLRAVGTHDGVYTDTVAVTAIGMPVVTVQPQSTAVLSGNSVNFAVAATGGDLSYQWYQGNSGETSSPVPSATSPSLTVANITSPRTFWVRITNPAGTVDSHSATVSLSQQAPSLKVNLGADLGGTWNSYATFAAFNGKLSETYSNLVFTNGANADGVSLTMTRSSTNEPFCVAIGNQTAAAPASDWLTDGAAQSFWFINFNNGTPPHQIAFSVAGLPAGTYDIEAFVYVDPAYGTPANAYKFNPIGTLAGINGTVAATDNPIDSASYNATATGSTILRWTDLHLETGTTIDLRTELPFNSKMPVINAFIIKGLALAVEAPSIDTQPAGVPLNEGESTTLTVAATTSGGPLRYQWYQGVSGDTAHPVGTDNDSFTTPALSETTGYWVRVTDDNGSKDSDTAVVRVQQSATAERILFIGNSFTNGYVDPAQSYNAANVTDLNGTGFGGVPGIFAKIASDSGYPVEVGIESVNGSTLLGRYPGKVDLVTNPAWDCYILQARSQEAMLDGRTDGSGISGSASVFHSTVGDWQTAILNARSGAKIWLYAPWASPTYVGDGNYYTEAEGTVTFLNEINTAYQTAFTTLGLDGWVPVGQAFADASDTGLTDLYHIDDHHANAAGSYLAAVMMYRQLLGADPRLLPTGAGSAPTDLGLSEFQTDTIHQLVFDFVYPDVQPLPPSIATEPADASILTGETATLTVGAVGASLSYQWYEGSSGDTSTALPGETSASLITPGMQTEGTFDYWVRVTNANGTVDSRTATVTVATANGGNTRWTAYHNTEALVVNPNQGLVSKGNAADTPYPLVDYADGTSADGATVTVSYTGIWSMNQSRAEAVMPDPGTDAHTLFDGKLALSGRTTFVSATNSPTAVIRFDNLDPAIRYSVRMTLNRGADFKDTQFELIDADTSTPASSNGIEVISDTAVAMNSNNTVQGYVAGWDEIEPVGSSGTSFAVRIVPGPQQNFVYLPQLIRIAATDDGPSGSGSFISWADGYGVTASETVDSEGDGINNLLEYAFDLDPNAIEIVGLPTVAVEHQSGTDYLTLTYRKNLDAPDLSWVFETSTTLEVGSWAPATVESDTLVEADPDGDDTAELRKVRVPVDAPRKFLRLTINP